jgi:sterol desaturase/sphingolipid hydroxylase (fatty acid hydroxylase superfamily)
MSGYNAIVLVAFIGLVSATLANLQSRCKLRQKPCQDWLLDGCGLAIQGVIIPLLQAVLYGLIRLKSPDLEASVHLPNITAFLTSFVLVDYLYYWNHRWLHRWAWRWHQVHHTVTEMDVLGTSRNTLWTSGLMIYLWIHPLLLYLIDHPAGYLLGVSLTAALDLWRHSGLNPPQFWDHWLSPWLVLPRDHAWHHAGSQNQAVNYGANFKWDRWHHTSYHTDAPPVTLGIPLRVSLWRKLFLP